MNLANKITTLRLFLIPVFVLSFLFLDPSSLIPVLIFLGASLTDFLDGAIARKRNLVTTFGKFMDPLADKLLTMTAFILLVEEGMIPAWVVCIIVARELFITGLRTIAASKGVTIAASMWGKVKTNVQMLTILALLMARDLSPEEGAMYLILDLLIALSCIFTLLSGVDYVWKNRKVLDLENL